MKLEHLPKKPFKVRIEGDWRARELIKKIDKYGRISLNARNLAEANDTFVFQQKPEGNYLVSFKSN
jgi:hypothetical protein